MHLVAAAIFSAGASAQIAPATSVGATSAPQTVNVTITTAGTSANTPGAAILVLTQGTTELDFNFVAGGTCAASTTYALNATCSVNYTFTPTHPWTRYGGVEIVAASGEVLGSALLTGIGNGPQAVFSLTTPTVPSSRGGGFYQPSGVAVDAAGNIYVADLNNGNVYEMPGTCLNASCVTQLGGGFSGPSNVAVDGSGNVYVADSNAIFVAEMPAGCANAACVTQLGGGFVRPAGIAVDGSGNVYVADYAQPAVTEMPPGCTNAGCMTSLGGGFSNPRDVAVDASGNVYVADQANQAVTVMPPNCLSVSCVVTLGGGFTEPFGVAVDGAGNVYVVDHGDESVKEMPPGCFSASCVVTLASSLNLPDKVAVDGAGNVYIIDQFYLSVLKLDFQDAPSLNFAGTPAGSPSAPQVVTLSNNGNTPLTVSAITPTNAALGTGTTCATSAAVGAGTSCGLGIEFVPSGPGTGMTGSVDVTDDTLNVNSTQTIALTGTGLGSGSTAQTITFPPLASPVQFGVGPATLPLTATSSSGLAVYYTIVGPATVSGSTLTITGPGAIVVTANQDGNATYTPATPVSISVFVSSGPILNVGTPSGTLTATMSFATGATLNPTLSSAINVVTQGAAGLDFNYVSGGTCAAGVTYNSGASCTVNYSFTPTHPWTRYGGIQLLDGSGTVVSSTYLTGIGVGAQTKFALSTPAVPISLGSGFLLPQGTAVDGNENVYVGDVYNGAVFEILASGGYTTVLPLGGGAFSYPAGVALDGIGNVYAANAGNATVTEMPPGCVASNCVTTLGGGYVQPLGIAVDATGNIYVADFGASVTKMPPGCPDDTCVVQLGGGFGNPFGVAVDAGGNVYVADRLNQTVTEMPANCLSASCVVNLGGGFVAPVGVTVDGAGNVYVSETGNELEMPPNCFSASCVTTLGSGFVNPFSVAIDGSGNIFVADGGNATVNEINVQNPPSLSFASTPVGTSGAQQLVTVTNNGNADLAFSAVAATANFSVAGAGTTCTAASPIGAGASCGLGILEAPTVIGALTGSANLIDNSLDVPNASQSILLSGTATQGTQTILFTQPVTPATSGTSVALVATGAPSGIPVIFSVISGPGTVSGTNGATLTYGGAGALLVAANQAGNANYATAPTVTLTVTVNSAVVGTTALATTTLTQNQATAGFTPVTGSGGTGALTYSVSPSLPAGLNYSVTTGTITGTPAVTSPATTYTVTVTDANNGTAAATFSLTVIPQSGQTITFSPATPVTFGVGPITLTATGGASGNPVTFILGAGSPASLIGNTLSITGAGTVTLTANQAGNASYPAAPPVIATITVNKATPTVELVSSANPTLVATSIAFTATVSSPAGTPTQTVTFYDNTAGIALGSASLNNGVAIFSTASVAAGQHLITAIYSGDGDFVGQTSAGLAQTVENFSISDVGSNPTTITIEPGGTATYQVTVSPGSNATFQTEIMLSASGLPPGATYTLTPATIAAGSGTTNAALTISVPNQTAMLRRKETLARAAAILPLSLLLLPFARPLRKRTKKTLRNIWWALFILAGAGAVTGVAGCGESAAVQASRSYTITVSATSGALSDSATFTLVVK